MSTDATDKPAEPQKSDIEDMVRLMFRQGKYADSVAVIRGHLVNHTDDVAAYELMADALRYSGDKAGSAGALATASELYARAGMTIQSIAAQKRVMKLGVEPDFSACRVETAAVDFGAEAADDRVHTPLFDDLSDIEFREVAERLESQTHAAGDVVVGEGDPGDSMFVIVRGRMSVSTAMRGADVVLAELGAGDFFGEAALLSGRPRTATIRAATDAECLVLSAASYQALTLRLPRMKQVMEQFNARRAASTIETLIKKKKA